jgi:hypothetical protein
LKPIFESLITSGVPALLGAWLGSTLGLRRFIRERSFERRLEWLIGAAKSVDSYKSSFKALIDDVRLGNGSHIESDFASLDACHQHLESSLADAEIFGGKNMAVLIRDLRSAMNVFPVARPDVINSTTILEKLEEGYKLLEPRLASLHAGLAADTRKLLKMR